MTTAELIAELEKLPPDTVVWLEIKYCDGELHQTPMESIDREGDDVYLQSAIL